MMNNAVYNRNGYIVIKEKVTPVRKILVCGYNNRAILIQSIYQLEEIEHALFVHRQISQLINYLAEMMKNIVNKDVETVYAPPRKGEILHCVADVSLAKESFGFKPSTEMYENLEEYIEWMRSDRGIANNDIEVEK